MGHAPHILCEVRIRLHGFFRLGSMNLVLAFEGALLGISLLSSTGRKVNAIRVVIAIYSLLAKLLVPFTIMSISVRCDTGDWMDGKSDVCRGLFLGG